MSDRKIRQVIAGRPLHTMPGDSTVIEAARRMADERIGALLVVVGGELAGIFTERDAVGRVLAKGLDPRTTTLSQVMTPEPRTVAADLPLAHALIIMHENGFRHLPVVDGDQVIGVVAVRDALGSEMSELTGNLDTLERLAENMR